MNAKKTQDIEKWIKEKALSEEARQVLTEVHRFAKCCIENEVMKQAMPSLFLVCDEGAGCSAFARDYEQILSWNYFFLCGGNSSFLDLSFPKSDSEFVYRKFFKSPKLAADVSNRFSGVFELGFDEWDGPELLKSEHFKKLLDMIDEMKDYTQFVFHISKKFEAKEELKKLLNVHVNMLEVQLDYPDCEQATTYIEKSLKNSGYRIGNAARKRLNRYVGEMIDLEKETFLGYYSLQQLARNIVYELCIEQGIAPRTKSDITATTMEAILDKLEVSPTTDEKCRRIGF